MKDKTDNSYRTSLVLNPTVGARLEQLVQQTRAVSSNALIAGIVAKIDPELALVLYRQAVAEGLIRPKAKTDPEKRALMERMKGLSTEELKGMMESRLGGPVSSGHGD